MHYTNSEMKLDQLIAYFNSKKIGLIPPFQRGHVWKLKNRQRLLENIVMGRPIPAVFLYKEADGSQFAYNILDGKQRLESLILFIGNARDDLRVSNVKDYFSSTKEKSQVNYAITLNGKKQTFKQLPEEKVRELREYAIPTIEIDLDDESSLDEIVNLFVDINQTGEKVKRFDIVKAIGTQNELLRSVLKLVAEEQKKSEDKIYKTRNTVFSRVLRKLQVVQNAPDKIQMVDRMWERLVEIVLFNRTNSHRQPGQILKAFIKTSGTSNTNALERTEEAKLNRVFRFLDHAYQNTALPDSRLARDLPHFYTMITSLLSSDLLRPDGAAPNYPGVTEKLVKFAKLLSSTGTTPVNVTKALSECKNAAEKQTTHPSQRKIRESRFIEIMTVI